MSILKAILPILALLLFLRLSDTVNSLPCKNSRCKTRLCNSTGDCICNLPDPITILEGDRPFLGGKFCDEEMIMCDGTNSFWCENGGKCGEIVQGEKYNCKCPPGYSGEHCEYKGKPCGQMFCFHEAECISEDEGCKCPPDWKRSSDCSLPTETLTDSSQNTTGAEYPPKGLSKHTSGMVAAFTILFALGATIGGSVYAKKLYANQEREAQGSQEMSQIETHAILDPDENSYTDHDRISVENSRL